MNPKEPATGRSTLRLLYVLGPAVLMMVMAVVQVHLLALVVRRPWSAQLVWMVAGLLWVGVVSVLWRRVLSGGWFFVWGPFLALTAIVAAYLGTSLSGVIPMGSHDPFPAAIVMLPAMGLLLCISFGTLIAGIVKQWRGKS